MTEQIILGPEFIDTSKRKDAKHYWLIPPQFINNLSNEFAFDFDPFPCQSQGRTDFDRKKTINIDNFHALFDLEWLTNRSDKGMAIYNLIDYL